VAIPCEVLDMVPAALGTAGYHGRIRTGRIRLL